jgi:hypothetical protein
MAVTELGGQLTQLHYRQQVAARTDVIRQLMAVFPALDVSSVDMVDQSWPAVERALELIIQQGHSTSAGLSINYYELFRAAEGIGGTSTPLLAEALPVEQVATSLRVTGPYTAKHLIATKSPQVARTTLARLIGSVSRLAMAGGRDTLGRSMMADRKALGYARVASGRSCAFCRMLASRGHVYRSESSATVRADGKRFHDLCDCQPEPVYSKDAALPPGSAAARELWERTTEGLGGKDALNAFRRAVERPAA